MQNKNVGFFTFFIRKLSKVFLLLFILFIFLFFFKGSSYALTSCDIEGIDVTNDERALFERVSNWRVQNKNKPPLQLSGPLNRAASWMAREVDNRVNNGHVDSLNRDWPQRFLDCGYPISQGTGESIKVNATADEAFNFWVGYTGNAMHAPTAFRCGGIGHYGKSWVVAYAVYADGKCPEAIGNPIPTNSSNLTITPTPISNISCDPEKNGTSNGKIDFADLRLARREIANLTNSNYASCITPPLFDDTSFLT